MIDSASSIAEIDVVDIKTLKSSAEAFLVKVTVTPETDAPETAHPEADITETGSKSETETDKPPVKKGCGGCGSIAALSAIAIVTAVGAAFIAKRKEN